MILSEAERQELERIAKKVRYLILRTVQHSGAGHIGGPLSAVELLVALYFKALRIDPKNPTWEDRDRFILSKGHAAVGLYAVMALRGFFPLEELLTFDKGGSRLQGHPDMTRLPGLDMSSGSLGQGLSPGVGYALGARLLGKDFHTFVLLGDGELQEGMVWEAVHTARRYELGNLTAILDYNGLQQYGWRGAGRGDRKDPWEGLPPARLFAAFDWRVIEIDGHDFDEILAALVLSKKEAKGPRPTAIVAHTLKGKGLSFTEGKHAWHSKVPSEEDVRRAMEELGLAPEEVPL